MQFDWGPDNPTPQLEEHSKAKLTVFRKYLAAYFDRLNKNPYKDKFKLSLVDGFCGGGMFLHGKELVSGTPLIMLEESEKAKDRLTSTRAKDFELDCKYYFVDATKAHTECLRKTLSDNGYQIAESKIVIANDRFENVVENIINDISARQPKSGRAIFLLDQTGFNQVHLEIVAQIFRSLPAAEVILTFAADALVNHLAVTPALIKAIAPLALKASHLRHLLEQKMEGGRALVQRTLRDHIRTITGATYDTPFFIRPEKSRRTLWFLHLSRHLVARDEMLHQHWDIPHTFEHLGTGDFDMLGWDAILDSVTPALFQFQELDRKKMQTRLLETMMPELYGTISEVPITVDGMRNLLANRTAARILDLDEILLTLFREKEVDLLSPESKVRTRTLRHIKPTDLIALPKTRFLPGISRRRGS